MPSNCCSNALILMTKRVCHQSPHSRSTSVVVGRTTPTAVLPRRGWAAGGPAAATIAPRRDPRYRVEASEAGEQVAGATISHQVHVPAAEVLVEGSAVLEPGERASDARSEREREGVGAGERTVGERTVGEVSTHMDFMVVTELVSHLSRGWLKLWAPKNLASERATRGASVGVSVSGRAHGERGQVPTLDPCSSPNSCPSC